jgi:hypothetical protein
MATSARSRTQEQKPAAKLSPPQPSPPGQSQPVSRGPAPLPSPPVAAEILAAAERNVRPSPRVPTKPRPGPKLSKPAADESPRKPSPPAAAPASKPAPPAPALTLVKPAPRVAETPRAAAAAPVPVVKPPAAPAATPESKTAKPAAPAPAVPVPAAPSAPAPAAKTTAAAEGAPPASAGETPVKGAEPTTAPSAEAKDAPEMAKGAGEEKKEATAEAKKEAAEEGAVPEGAGGAPAVDVKLHMPEPPTTVSPATKKRIGGVTGRAGATAAAQAALPAGSAQVGDARQAVTPPSAEQNAKAQADLIAQLGDAPAPSPEIVKLCERIRDVIRRKRPPDEDALMEAKPDKEASEAGNQLNSTVNDETKKVQGGYSALDKPPEGQPAPKGADLPPQPGAAATPGVNAAAATPDAVPAGNVSLDKDAEASKKKIEDAGMTTPAAQLVQSGPVAEARGAQGELDQAAKEDPAKVLARQKDALGRAEGDMAALQQQALAALTASRKGTVKAAGSQQSGMVVSEETKRANASAEAQSVFAETQKQVKALLEPLATNAMNEWEAAKEVLVSQFKADLAIVQKRVEERHAGVGGWFVGLWDAVTGLPGWAEEAYTKAEKNFGDGVCTKLTEISVKVNSVIATCVALIKNAKQRIAEIFSNLGGSLAAWAAAEQAKFDGQLDKLQEEALAARDAFNKDLVERSSAAVDEVRAEIAELRKKAGGLVGRIVAAVNRFIEDPVKFIIEGLLELLGIPPAAFWAVVAKIKKVIKDIADDPMKFANNLLAGLAQGFSLFFDHIGDHLFKGFISWLTGGLGSVGVQLPKDLSLKSIITFFLQLMGITWPRIRKILVKHVGEKNVALVEKVYSLLSLLIEKGPEGIVEMIKEKLDPQSIVDQVVQMAVDYMISAIMKAAAARIIALFNPAGAIVQALEAIYRVLKWIFQNAARIFTLVETVVNGVADILSGAIGGFATAVEKGLGMLIAPVIGFIADYLGFGDLPATIASKIKSFQEMILGFVESALVWMIEKGKALLAALGLGGKDKDKKDGKFDGEIGKTIHWVGDKHPHKLWVAEAGGGVSVRMSSVETDVATQLDEYETKAKDLPEEKQKDALDKIATARSLLSDVQTEAGEVQQGASAEEKPQDLESKDDAVESSEQQLAAQLKAIQEILGVLPPDVVKARAKDEVAKLPRSMFGVSDLQSSLDAIYEKLAPLGLKSLYVGPAGSDFEILASASDPLVVRRLLALHASSHLGCCFLIARIDGQSVLPAGEDLLIWNDGQGGRHAEEKLDSYLRRRLPRPETYRGPLKRVDIVIRWSPCLGGCTPVLLQLQHDYAAVVGEWEIVYFGEYQTAEHPVEDARAGIALLAGAGICIREVTAADQMLAVGAGDKK